MVQQHLHQSKLGKVEIVGMDGTFTRYLSLALSLPVGCFVNPQANVNFIRVWT